MDDPTHRHFYTVRLERKSSLGSVPNLSRSSSLQIFDLSLIYAFSDGPFVRGPLDTEGVSALSTPASRHLKTTAARVPGTDLASPFAPPSSLQQPRNPVAATTLHPRRTRRWEN